MHACLRHLVTASLALAGCSEASLSVASSQLVVEPGALAFERTFVGYPTRRALEVRNAGRAPLRVEVEAPGGFRVEPAAFDLASAGAARLEVTFDPRDAAVFEGALVVQAEGAELAVPLSASAELPIPCAAPAPCHSVAFDPAAGACLEASVPDGTACALDDRCLGEARCSRGECVGLPISCDDGDVCTDDACDPAVGCEHRDASGKCPAPSDPCHVPICDAVGGCGVANAADGTPCGSADCTTAEVCILGSCVTVPVPEGTTCFPETPCQGQGVCRNKVCERPQPEALTARWSYVSPEGLGLQFPGTVDEQGQLYLLETGRDRGAFTSLTRDGFQRFRRPLAATAWSWYGATIALEPGGQVAYLTNSRTVVDARRTADGAQLWEIDLSQVLTEADTAGYPRDFSVQALTPHPRQGLLVVVAVVGRESHLSFLVGLDAATGAPRWKLSRAGHFYGYVADAEGHSFVSAYGCWASSGDLLSVAADGQVRWSTPAGGHPRVQANGELLVYRNTGLVAVDAAKGDDGPTLSTAASFTDEALLGSREAFVWERAWSGGTSTLLLRSLDPATGADRWVAHPAEQAVRGTPMITSRGTLLTATELALYTDDRLPRHTLREYGPGGAEVFACELPGVLEGTAALAGGRWIAEVGGALQSFEAPGLSLASSGWVTAQGSLSRTSQPR